MPLQHLTLNLSEGFELWLDSGAELDSLSELRSLTLSGGKFSDAMVARLLTGLAYACPRLEELRVLPDAVCGLGNDEVPFLVQLKSLKVRHMTAGWRRGCSQCRGYELGVTAVKSSDVPMMLLDEIAIDGGSAVVCALCFTLRKFSNKECLWSYSAKCCADNLPSKVCWSGCHLLFRVILDAFAAAPS